MSNPDSSPNAEERSFLHNISSPLSSCLFSADLLKERLAELGQSDAVLIKNLDRILAGLHKTKEMISDRRHLLIERDNPE